MTIDKDQNEIDLKNDKAFIGHPKGLGFIAFTEAWERFSYYGMQSLLVLYMSKFLLHPGHIENILFFDFFAAHYKETDPKALASLIYGDYAAWVYMTPLLGGLIADRFIGRTPAIIIGAVLMALGHFLMAFDPTFLIALLCLIMGSGFFKGNLQGQVGSLYKPEDNRRADAFQIYYLAINAGVIISPLIVGTLGENKGWHWGFGAAGIGMLISIIIYLFGLKHYPKSVIEKVNKGEKKPPLSAEDWKMVGLLTLIVPVLAIGMLPNQQIFNAYLLWGDKDFNLMWNGSKLPTTWLVTLDSIVSVTFLALVALFFRWYGTKWKEPDEITKIIIGTFIAMLGMFCLVAAEMTKGADGKIGLFWPVMFHFVNSIGFAMVLPIALALFMRLAPLQMVGLVTGIFNITFFIANKTVGKIGALFEKMPTVQFWLLHAAAAGFACLVFIGLKIALRKKLATVEV